VKLILLELIFWGEGVLNTRISCSGKGKANSINAWTSLEGSGSFRLPDVMAIGA
jgi:hypothetical protein